MSEEELEELRRRRLLELRRRLAQEQEKTQRAQQLEMQKQSLLRRILTADARQRLTNLKIVKPEFANQLELPMTDEQLKEILIRLQSQRRDIKIRRV